MVIMMMTNKTSEQDNQLTGQIRLHRGGSAVCKYLILDIVSKQERDGELARHNVYKNTDVRLYFAMIITEGCRVLTLSETFIKMLEPLTENMRG